MWHRDVPILEADPDPLRRGLRSAWRHTHWILAGSALWSIGLLVALHTAEGSVARAVAVGGLLTLPGTAALTVVADRIVVRADCDTRALRSIPRRTWLRALHVPAVGAALLILAMGALLALPGMPGALGLAAVTLCGAGLLAYTLLAPSAAATDSHRPTAPLRRVWLVAFLATSARPVPVLGALCGLGLLTAAVWHLQILLFLAPGIAAIVLTAAAWATLIPMGLSPAPLRPTPSAQPIPAPHERNAYP